MLLDIVNFKHDCFGHRYTGTKIINIDMLVENIQSHQMPNLLHCAE
jgi:hypothetical protein